MLRKNRRGSASYAPSIWVHCSGEITMVMKAGLANSLWTTPDPDALACTHRWTVPPGAAVLHAWSTTATSTVTDAGFWMVTPIVSSELCAVTESRCGTDVPPPPVGGRGVAVTVSEAVPIMLPAPTACTWNE